jgi:arginine exporter protein ArgO
MGRMSLSVTITGLLTGLSLIFAIGAQNAFVLRQGLLASMCLRSVSPAACRTRP